MPLNLNGDLRVAAGTLHDSAVTNHNRERVYRGRGKSKKLSDMGLHKIVRTTAIDKYGEVVMVDRVVHAEGFRDRHAGERVQAQLGLRVV